MRQKGRTVGVGMALLLVAVGNAWGAIPPVTVKELVAGPLAQGRGHTAEKALFTFPGNAAEPARALMTYHQRVHLNGLAMAPSGRRSYARTLAQFGIRQWIAKGGSVSLRMVGPVAVSGPDDRPELCYPVRLLKERGTHRITTPERLCLSYARTHLAAGMSAIPAVVSVRMKSLK